MVQDNDNVIWLQTGHLNRFFSQKKQKSINLKLLSIKSNFYFTSIIFRQEKLQLILIKYGCLSFSGRNGYKRHRPGSSLFWFVLQVHWPHRQESRAEGGTGQQQSFPRCAFLADRLYMLFLVEIERFHISRQKD